MLEDVNVDKASIGHQVRKVGNRSGRVLDWQEEMLDGLQGCAIDRVVIRRQGPDNLDFQPSAEFKGVEALAKDMNPVPVETVYLKSKYK